MMSKLTLFAVAAAAVAASAQSDASTCAPEAFFVNYLNQDSQMVVSWSTNCSASTVVNYGYAANGLNLKVAGNATQYKFEPSSGSTYTSPYLHHAVLTGLPLNTRVFYQVGGDNSGYSSTMNFTSARGPALNSDGNSAFFAFVGDLGQTSNSVDTLNHIISATADKFVALVHPGDLSYADSVETRWQSYANQIAPLAQALPWMPTVGNHENEYCKGGQSFIAYETRYFLPYVYYGTSQQTQQLWYSFETSGVHFISLSSYSDFDSSSDQYAWLQQDLASVDRSVTPWLIVQLHAPWYNSNTAHQGEGETMRQAMEQMLYDAEVDVVFAGHVHAYERCHRSFNMQPDSKGPYYITIGDGGNREGLASNWESPQPAWSAFRQASYGHGELEVINATTMHWTWHQNPDLEPTVADDLYIVKGQDTFPARSLRTATGITSVPKFRVKPAAL